MNINNRLKKLEQDMGADNQSGEICQCFDKDILTSIGKVYGTAYNEADILPEGTPIGDFCERCTKPVAQRIRDFYRDVNESYGEGVLV